MAQREITLRLENERLAPSQKTAGYAGEHLATLLRFELPESWIADQSLQYYVSYYVEGTEKCYRTEPTPWPVEAALPQALMEEGELLVQLNAVDQNNESKRLIKSAACKLLVQRSVSDLTEPVDDNTLGLIDGSLAEMRKILEDIRKTEAEVAADAQRVSQDREAVEQLTEAFQATAAQALVDLNETGSEQVQRVQDAGATISQFEARLATEHSVLQPIHDSAGELLLDSSGDSLVGQVIFADMSEIIALRKSITALETVVQNAMTLLVPSRVTGLENANLETAARLSNLENHALLDSDYEYGV